MANNYFNINRFKRNLLILCSTLITLSGVAQTTFNFDATAPLYGGASADDRKPLGVWYGYERSHFVYTAAELGNLPVGSIIDSVGFFLTTYNVPPEQDYDFKIYVREVASTTITSSNWPALTASAVLRFQGTMSRSRLGTCGAGGTLSQWLTTPLDLNTTQITAGGSLEFMVEVNWATSPTTGFDPNGWFLNNSACGAGSSVGFSNSIMFAQNTKTSSGEFWNQDNNPPTGNAVVVNRRPNLRIVSHLAAPCNSQPIPAFGVIQANASSNPVCGSPFNLGLINLPGLSGYTFQWYSSTVSNAGPWTLIGGATQAYYLATQSQQTWYYCQVTCPATPGSVNSTVIQVNQNPLFNCYCGPNTGISLHGVACTNAFINTVSLNSLNNVNTNCTNGNGQAYTLYPFSGSTTTAIRQGQTYTLSIQTGGSSQSISVYIDWNHNGVFTDPGEWYGLTGNPPIVLGAGTYSIPLTVPSGLGVSSFPTGMRVRSRVIGGVNNNASTPCLQYFSGETEDYGITVDPVVLPFCNTIPSAATSRSPLGTVCSGSAITLKVNPDPSLTNQGWNYQWQYDNGLGWTNFGAANSTIVTSQSKYTRYKCLITCPSSGFSIFSDSMNVPISPTTWLGRNPSTGLASNNWNDGANWCGHVPTIADSVQIDKVAAGNPANYLCPVVNGDSVAASAYYLKVALGDSLTIKANQGNTFTVIRDVNNLGFINISSTKSDSIPFSSSSFGGPANWTPFFGAGVREERSQLMYDSTELALKGLVAGDVIDTLYFHFKSRASINPYPNFKIWAGYTTDGAFPGSTFYPTASLTTIYSNPFLNLTSIPTTGGTLALPVTGFTWDGHRSIILQFCWDTPTGTMPGGKDLLYTNQTLFRSYLQVITSVSSGLGGCDMVYVPVPQYNLWFTPRFDRPNITFRVHRPQNTVISTIGTLAGGGGINNNGNGSRFYMSRTNLTVNGSIINDGVIGIDTSNVTIAPSAGNTGDFINGGTLDLSFTPVLTQRKSQIFFNGTNWTNNGTMTPGTKSRVVFGGGLAQTIGGLNPSTFWDMRMEKSAAANQITLAQSITVNDSLSLGNGRILLNGRTININNTSTWGIWKGVTNSPVVNGVLIAEDSVSRVKWRINTTLGNHMIPFANGTASHFIPDTVIYNSGAALGTISIGTYPSVGNTPGNYPPGVTSLNNTLGAGNASETADRYWLVSRLDSTGATNTTLTFAYTDAERPIGTAYPANPAKAQPWGQAGGWRIAPGVQLYSYAPTFGSPPPAASAARVHTVRVPGYVWTFGSSNPWAVATTLSPLPIQLVSFTAKADNDQTKINWATASEDNNDYFTVQRTTDFNTSVDIDRVASKNGNSNEMQYYETFDQHPVKGINYYRLLQTDLGGTAVPASDYVAVRFGVKSTFDILYITHETQVEVIFDYDSELPVDYTVTDMLGKTVASGANNPATAGVNILRLDASAWPHGMYLITLQNKDKGVTRKMVY